MRLFRDKHFISLLLIVLLTVFLRFYLLDKIPAGFLNDEANLGYDSYSLLQTGKDQWGNLFPLNNFIGFGDYPRPINRYLSVIPIYLFDLNEFSVRFISALSGVLSVIAIYYLVSKLFNKKAAFFSSLILAVMPWAIGLNRIGHESNIAILFLILSIFFGILKKNKSSLYLSFFFLALSMYTYSAYILFSPLVLITVLYLNFKKSNNLKSFIKPLILFIILISPIIFQKNAASVRFSQVGLTTNITSVGLINDLNDERGQCQSILNSPICKLNNKTILFTGVFIKNYLSHFSPGFLYSNGTSTQLSILPKRGLDYIFNIVPLVFGFLFLLKNNKNRKINTALIVLFLLAPLPDSLTSDGNYVRASIMQPFIAIITGLGYFYLIEIIAFRFKSLRLTASALIVMVLLFSLLSFFMLYTTYFRNNHAMFSQYGYKELMLKIKQNENLFDNIYLSTHLNDAKQYIYYLFYTKYDPSQYQQKKDIVYSYESNEWISIEKIGKINFLSTIPKALSLEEKNIKKVLIISHPKDFPQNISTFFVVKDRLGNVIFKAVALSDLLEYNRVNKELTKQ